MVGGGGGFRGGGGGMVGGGFRGGTVGGFHGGGFVGGGHGFVGGGFRSGNAFFRGRGFGFRGFYGGYWPYGVSYAYWPYYPYYSYPYYDYGYSYDPYDYPGGYSYPISSYSSGYANYAPAQQPANVTVVVPPAQSANPVVREYDQYGQEIHRGGSAADAAPPSGSPVYLIAFKDHVIRPAAAYWVAGNTLHYVSLDHQEHQVQMDTVDRAMSEQLNRERRVQFSLK